MSTEELAAFVRDVKDFPKEGIVFKDLTTLMQNPRAFRAASEALMKNMEGQQVDKVACVESRGFFFGALLADRLSAGFVPIRKPGKLPYKTRKECYALEYGNDCLEIHEDAIRPGEKILMHDDLLATGGTALAACKLIEQLGGEIIQASFLIELSFLKGRDKLSAYPTYAVLSY
ncbi:MAG: adenine phosphoribosyltransferase [Cyclobacteriaceae bacterium]